MDAILKKPKQYIITCEHAVNTIPSAYQPLFHQQPDVLDSHRAIDFGARYIAKQFTQVLKCPLFEATTSRLLIECNRSLNHPKCFSEFTQGLTEEEKQVLIDQYYQPFRQAAETYIGNTIEKGIQIIHLSIHSFTPVFNNIPRNADIGLLYDPTRRGEKTLAAQWREYLLKEKAPYHVRMNYPYQGISNGFVSSLRKQYPETSYLGFEVESNQALTQDASKLEALSQSLTSSFSHLLRDER
jgi:predicted N-formylglutamate amidohydrolase